MQTYIIELSVEPLVDARSVVQHGVGVSEPHPVPAQIVRHKVNGI